MRQELQPLDWFIKSALRLPNAPAKLRALNEKEASRQLQPVVRWHLK
jgi:hypothetical protein